MTRASFKPTYYTKHDGMTILTKEPYAGPQSEVLKRVISATGYLAGTQGSQTGLWVTLVLHIQPWHEGLPTDIECAVVRDLKMSFRVDTEVLCRMLYPDSVHSLEVNLVSFSVPEDIAIFKLADPHARATSWVGVVNLMA